MKLSFFLACVKESATCLERLSLLSSLLSASSKLPLLQQGNGRLEDEVTWRLGEAPSKSVRELRQVKSWLD